ncbi:methyltransferase domain-containing protein [Congregibacter brevis]|uniref:Methyltransferase domain-containing protein n=1 Tax=Congregibacter brevis TaxID=3081201 RepID=A0ABZ0IFA6_9GAMM|nr:methyltransferase domain-containing protein [Congregibacter sp. IMCC45268]
MQAIYDKIGKGYSTGRKEDPQIASCLWGYLAGATSLLNLGAGTGSYEPHIHDLEVTALEPSLQMIEQRPLGAAPVMQGYAESLPFESRRFSHSMTVLSMHHWLDRKRAFAEIKRVTNTRFVAITWDPGSPSYWLTKDYFPEIHAIDSENFPSLDEIAESFPGVAFFPLEIPADCADGFTAAYWARPHAYLDPLVRSCMSTFAKVQEVESGLDRLRADLDCGLWKEKYGQLMYKDKLDVGYKIAVWNA